MSKLLNVLLVGGTHGNELTGIHLVKRWQSLPDEIARQGLKTELLLSNEAASKLNRRYIDADLNRQFSLSELKDSELSSCEALRAKEINELLGFKQTPSQDFIIDMHTTTANMGVTLVVNGDSELALKVAAYVQSKDPGVTIMHQQVNRDDDNFLISLGKFGGIVVEVGPVAQGLLNAEIFEKTRLTVQAILDFLSLQQLTEVVLPKKISAYQFIEKIKLPENENGDLVGMIHPKLQNRDFQPLKQGDAIFLLQTGETQYYEGLPNCVAAFINEAAYYDQHHGFSLLKPVQLQLTN